MGTTILVFDRDEPTRELIARVLDDEGYCVVGAEEPCGSLVQQHDPALIILDLPPMRLERGIRQIEELRDASSERRAPIIVASTNGHVLADMALHLDAHGCRPLVKPFGLDSLIRSVREAIDARSCCV